MSNPFKSALNVRTTTKREHKLLLTASLIRRALDNSGLTIPDDAKITVWVPGGGDWSNTELEIDDRERLVHVVWKEEELG